MSRILWEHLFIPDLTSPTTVIRDEHFKSQIENVRSYPKTSSEIEVPDPKAFRSMSRASIFLSHICMGAQATIAPFLAESPFAVGIYCAVESGPIDAPSTAKILQQNNPAQFPEYYRKFRNPKMYLKQLPNLVSAQMGISMGLQGPMNVYTHSTAGSIHALEQAEWDLKTGVVKAALVCSAHAFDDFLVVKRTRHFDSRCLVEAAGALLLVPDERFINWTSQAKTDSINFFGISDPIINFLRRNKNG